MLNEYTIIFRDLEFEGLKFRRSKSYGESDYDSLVAEGSYYSEIRCKKSLDNEATERIHINLSYSALLRLLTFPLIGLALILALIRLTWPSVVLAGISLGLLSISTMLRRRADRDYKMRETVSNIVEMVFEEKREKAEGADDRPSNHSAG